MKMNLADVLAKATPGPMGHAEDHHGDGSIDNGRLSIFRATPAAKGCDAALLAHCRNKLPGLLEALKRLAQHPAFADDSTEFNEGGYAYEAIKDAESVEIS